MTAASDTGEVLRLQGLTCRFGALVAVDGVDLAVPAGQTRAVLGANGAGKTTLFNMIAGDLAPSEGRITVFGEDITALSAERRVAKGIRRTYQKSLVFAGLTVRENLFVAIRGAKGPRFAFAARVERHGHWAEAAELAARVNLEDRLEAKAGEISHGEMRQLELGMALASPPTLLLLDEPAAGLSLREREALVAMIRALPDDLTLILIEHDLDIALSLADRVTVMHNGAVLAEGTPAEISANQEIQDIYMGTHGR